MEHYLDKSIIYNRWNQAYEPRLTIAPGDTVTIEMNDASDGQVHPGMTAAAFDKIDKMRIHALTGPICVEGAEIGDSLEIDILDFEHEGWAWTSIIPGLGLLSEDFTDPFLHIWELGETQTKSIPGVTLDLNPFCGIIGVQKAEPGEFRTRPPGVHGGNLDVKHLTAGAKLRLPVLMHGAGLCAGDCHGAQGDGEVCINGMEAPMKVTLKVALRKGVTIPGPEATVSGQLVSPRYAAKPFHTFIESGEDPIENSRNVVRRAIDYIVGRLGISRELAYVLCSVVLDLKISQLVNAPTVTVSGYLPEAIFD